MNAKKDTLFLVDAMSMIYRAYFALSRSPIINSKGLNTSAILGFSNVIVDILKNEKPSHIGVAFDSAAPTFRHEEFVEYKAQREAMPEEIAVSIPYIKDILNKMGIPVFAVDGFEADDIVGTLAKKAELSGFTVFMMTSDKDFGQLVSENVFVYRPSKQGNPPEIIGPSEVCKKYEISHPEQLIDILGLWGDASDNIPGIPGIGEVKAKKLIGEFKSVENLIQRAHSIENIKLRELVQQYADQAIFSKQLATIETKMNIDFDPEKFRWTLPEPAPLIELFKELEFRTFSKRFFDAFFTDIPQPKMPQHGLQTSLFDEQPTSSENSAVTILQSFDRTTVQYNLVTNMDEFATLIQKLHDAPVFAFDTETTGLSPFDDEIIGISFCTEEGKASYLPVLEEFFLMKDIQPFLQQIFDDEHSEKIAHNLKFDMRMLHKYGINIKGKVFDTMLAHYLINPESKHNLDFLSETYLSYKPISFEDLIPMKNPGPEEMRKIPPEAMKDYSCEDADMAFRLYTLFKKQLHDLDMTDLFQNVEMPLVYVLARMEEAGIAINTDELALFSKELAKQIALLEHDIFEIAGVTFNMSSPKQLGEVLFEKLKISDKPTKTKTKQYATGEEVLQKYVNKHPIIEHILKHRTLTKLKTTYVDALPKSLHLKTGRIHTMYHQAVTATGRLSSSNPNVQNIPIRTDLGQEIRKAFIPRNNDYVLLSADYSQIELRIIAALSNETAMIDAFSKGIDIHTATASRIYNIPVEEVSSAQRRNAKTVNFGIIYGISGFGLSERLGISRKEAEQLIEDYFNKYPNIKSYLDSTIEFAQKNGYVETILMRKRLIPNINSANAFIRGFAERTAINAPVQGSAADMIKLAMISIHKRFEKEKLKSAMLLQVHDELVFDIYKPELEKAREIIRTEMINAIELPVIIDVEIKTGINWLDAH
jgi:DNA polymerase I